MLDPPRGRLRHDADADLAFDHAADRVEAAQLHAQPQRLADARRLVGEEALQRAGAVEPDEVAVEHLRKRDFRALGERMVARHHQHEAVAAERIGFERARIHGAGDDAEIGNAFRDQADDLVAEPLLEIDADMRMRRQERAQRLRQEFGERVGVGQHPDLPGDAAGIGAEILAQPLGLPQDGARVLQQRAAGLRRLHALPAAHQQGGAERVLHVADARRRGGEREVGALRAVRDAAGVDDVAEQAQIGEIEAHGSPLPSAPPSNLTKVDYVKSSL